VKIGSVRHRNNIAWLVSSKTWAGEAQKRAGATAPQSAFNISAAPYQIFGNAPRFPRRLVNEPQICVISSRARPNLVISHLSRTERNSAAVLRNF
jgi:hypothetical protein